MIEARPYSDQSAMVVLSSLDPFDHLEVEAAQGRQVGHLALFADWRSLQAISLESLVFCTGRAEGAQPFGLLAVTMTGQAGVAVASFLARDHRRYRRQIAEAAIMIRGAMHDLAARAGLNRIEVRCWALHPTASSFLELLGFVHEADLCGFGGPDRHHVFRQFAWFPGECQQSQPNPVQEI